MGVSGPSLLVESTDSRVSGPSLLIESTDSMIYTTYVLIVKASKCASPIINTTQQRTVVTIF